MIDASRGPMPKNPASNISTSSSTPLRAHVVGRADDVARHAGRLELGAVEVDEAVVAGGDAAPQLVDVGGAWEAAGHRHDGDVGLGRLGGGVVGVHQRTALRVVLVRCDG